MTGVLRRARAALPGLEGMRKWYHYFRKGFYRYRSRRELFTHQYFHDSNQWRGETVCGPGSTIQATAAIRRDLPLLFTQLGIRRVLDAPCGDFNWFREVPLEEGVEYTGGDIVAEIIARNQRLYAAQRRSFRVLDLLRDPLPDADIWLCRDCLIHFSNADAVRAIERFCASGIRYLLTTTFPGCEQNRDIPTGAFHPVNLSLKPFGLGPPCLLVSDAISCFPDKSLGLWEREAVRRSRGE